MSFQQNAVYPFPPQPYALVNAGSVIIPIDGEACPLWNFELRMGYLAAGPTDFYLRPNGVSTAQLGTQALGETYSTSTNWNLPQQASSIRSIMWGQVWTRTGAKRGFWVRAMRGPSSGPLRGGGVWTDTTTPITGLHFVMASGNLNLSDVGNTVRVWPETTVQH